MVLSNADYVSHQPVVPSDKFIKNANHYRFFSHRLQRAVDAYSWLERMYLLSLEFDASVHYYCEQPIRISERINGKQLTYTPDVCVSRGAVSEFVEVKPYERLVLHNGKLVPWRWPRIQAWADKHDQTVSFVTDREILCDPLRMRNLLLLAPFLRAMQFFPGSPIRRLLYQDIKNSRPRRICDWVEDYNHVHPTELVGSLSVLYQHGRIDLPLSNALVTPSTVVSHASV